MGESGWGKTYLARKLVLHCDRLIVLDYMADPAPHGWAADCVVVTTWDDLLEQVQRPRFRVAVQIDEDPAEVLDLVCELARSESAPNRPAVGPVMLVVEELSIPFHNPTVKCSQPVQEVVRMARREGVSFLMITQVFVDCPKLIRRHLTDLYLFHTQDQTDLDLHRRAYGVLVPSILFKLPKYSYCHFDRSRGTLPVVVDRAGVRRLLSDKTETRKPDAVADGGGNRAGDGVDRGTVPAPAPGRDGGSVE